MNEVKSIFCDEIEGETKKSNVMWGKPQFSKRQQGVTLIEIVVYMAIALIFIALAGGRIFDAFSSQGAQTETDNIISMISATKETRGRAGYGAAAADLNKTIIALGRVPNALSVVGSTTQIVNSWDGDVKVIAKGGTDLNSFTISTANVPNAACIKMVQRISETGLVLDTTSTGGSTKTAGIIASSQAVLMCDAATNINTITWTVKG